MAAQNNAPLPDGLEIAGYRIVKKIASGGFSIVYLAYDAEGNAVAIKEYLPSQLALRAPGELAPSVSKPNLAVFRIGLKCFFEEGRALARIVHPNVVRVVNFFRANETVYMVMAYESGHTLQDHIARLHARGSRMGEDSIRQLFNGVCAGVREVHANKLLHLDLKPANIYLRGDGSPLLLDFGAARQTINIDVPMLAPMYTPGFAAPELYSKAAQLGPWTDIYSIGAAMYACMTRSMPQPVEARKQGDKTPAQLAKLAGSYSPELVDMVGSCMALDPLARLPSVFAMQKVLQAAPSVAAQVEDEEPAAPAAGWRGLVGRLGGIGRKARTQD
ncbi:serine/threonine protein kinase [Telluria aromaticivorans]|uniref:Serine/threonine protein kinase n=1 Tax=Telluria aromaticivorans TaxID=2725995 RepID=A0A7Y2JX12_9BURK|nr:serine/threonine-protein kinase [Telluria aromaticivorans]NNG22577.1 serine/threonine protein kinase [Telluria aromaticivorans]